MCPDPPSPHLFDRSTVKLCFDGDGLTIFDYSIHNALLFSQGDWSLTRRDLELAGVDEVSIEALEDGPCSELIRAYRARRELIHYKKVCLHLFEEAQKIERELKQAMSFFFWNDGDERELGAKTHIEAIRELSPSALHDDISPLNLEVVNTAMKRHETGDCTLLDRKILYTLACGAWMYHTGIQRAIHDARDVAKAICMSPRHPEGEANGERPSKLVSLPASMQVYQSLQTAMQEDPSKSRRERQGKAGINSQASIHTSSSQKNESTGAKGACSLQRILHNTRTQLGWSEEAIHFLSLSIAARGGFKALAIVQELRLYNQHLSDLPSRLSAALHKYQSTHMQITEKMSNSETDADDDDLGAAVRRLHQIHSLRGALKACRENARWIAIIESLCRDSSTTSRLFVAGDNVNFNEACAFVPKGFELGSFVTSSRHILDRILIPAMKAAITVGMESWPPTARSRRSRVLAFDEKTLKHAGIGTKKLLRCQSCCGYFNSRWVRHHLCSVCEMKKRQDHCGDSCLFKDCRGGAHAYCVHFKRCFLCDAPHSCERLCRLSRGSGEVATALVESIRPSLLLLDFDRTLCSTKCGASPLPKRKTASDPHQKEGHAHSIDPELRVTIAAQRGTSYIVTRNSHKAEIEQFLRQQGLVELSKNVHVVPKNVSKGSFIQETFFGEDNGQTCLCIDDDIRELINDPWMRNCEQVHRLLFVRAFAT